MRQPDFFARSGIENFVVSRDCAGKRVRVATPTMHPPSAVDVRLTGVSSAVFTTPSLSMTKRTDTSGDPLKSAA